MASETVDPINWSHPPPSWAVPPERLVHSINRCSSATAGIRSCNFSAFEATTLSMPIVLRVGSYCLSASAACRLIRRVSYIVLRVGSHCVSTSIACIARAPVLSVCPATSAITYPAIRACMSSCPGHVRSRQMLYKKLGLRYCKQPRPAFMSNIKGLNIYLGHVF